MTLIDRPCCDEPMLIDGPLPASLHCADCNVTWHIADPVPEPVAMAA